MDTVVMRSVKAGLAIGLASLLLLVTLSSTIGTERIQMGTQSYTEKAQRATEKNSVKLCVSSVLSVFLFKWQRSRTV